MDVVVLLLLVVVLEVVVAWEGVWIMELILRVVVVVLVVPQAFLIALAGLLEPELRKR